MVKLRHFFLIFALFGWVKSSSSLITNVATKLATPYAKRIRKSFSGESTKFTCKYDKSELENPVKALTVIPQFNLRNKEFVGELVRSHDLPAHLLKNPEFFDEALELGHRSLCQHLLRRGQVVNILKDNGDNLFVKIIQKRMPELIGMLTETGSYEAMRALKTVDAASGLSPFDAAMKTQDLIAVLEVVSPRQSRPNRK